MEIFVWAALCLLVFNDWKKYTNPFHQTRGDFIGQTNKYHDRKDPMNITLRKNNSKKFRLPNTNIVHPKNVGWETILSFLGRKAYFQGRFGHGFRGRVYRLYGEWPSHLQWWESL